MFHVSLEGKAYRISVGDGAPCHARTLVEVQLALEHYYGDRKGENAVHMDNREPACPFCVQQRSV